MLLNRNFFRKVVPPSKSFQKKKCIKKSTLPKPFQVAGSRIAAAAPSAAVSLKEQQISWWFPRAVIVESCAQPPVFETQFHLDDLRTSPLQQREQLEGTHHPLKYQKYTKLQSTSWALRLQFVIYWFNSQDTFNQTPARCCSQKLMQPRSRPP